MLEPEEICRHLSLAWKDIVFNFLSCETFLLIDGSGDTLAEGEVGGWGTERGGVFWCLSLLSAPVCKKTEPPRPMRHIPKPFESSFLSRAGVECQAWKQGVWGMSLLCTVK